MRQLKYEDESGVVHEFKPNAVRQQTQQAVAKRRKKRKPKPAPPSLKKLYEDTRVSLMFTVYLSVLMAALFILAREAMVTREVVARVCAIKTFINAP